MSHERIIKHWAGCWKLDGHHKCAKARIAGLESALNPFAEWVDKLDTEFADHEDDVICGGLLWAPVTFGNLRQARKALRS